MGLLKRFLNVDTPRPNLIAPSHVYVLYEKQLVNPCHHRLKVESHSSRSPLLTMSNMGTDHERHPDRFQKDWNNSGTSCCSSRSMLLIDSVASTPSFGLLAMQSSWNSIQDHPFVDILDEESLSDIVENKESNQDKEYDIQPYLHRRHESSSSCHWSFEESLEICFGGEQGQHPQTSSDSHHVSIDKSNNSATEHKMQRASLEPPIEDRLRRPRQHPRKASSSSFDQSISSLSSLHIEQCFVDKIQPKVRCIPDNVLRDRSLQLERSLNLFAPHKSLGSNGKIVQMDDKDHQEPMTFSSHQQTPPDKVLVQQTPVQGSLAENGVLTYPDGRRFEGRYVGNRNLVQGVMRYPDGTIYRGGWSHGKRQGHGVVDFPDGSRYIGDFEGGEFHGEGKLTWSDGGYYVGAWEHGHIQGKGMEVRADGSMRHDGRWQQGRPFRTAIEQGQRSANAKVTSRNCTPTVIHLVKMASVRSVDSISTLGTSVSMYD